MPVNAVAAALILADKADVRRSRVRNQDTTTFDIHDRVNYSVKKSTLKINEDRTLVKLKLTVDTHFGSVMDYFEIFMQRMILCRKAAEKLGLQFKLIINEQQLICAVPHPDRSRDTAAPTSRSAGRGPRCCNARQAAR